MRINGYGFVHNQTKGGWEKRVPQRRRVFPLDNQVILVLLPVETDLESVRYEEAGMQLFVTDGKHCKIEVSEFNSVVG